MPVFCGFWVECPNFKKKIKMFMKKRLTFLEYRFIVYGLSKLER